MGRMPERTCDDCELCIKITYDEPEQKCAYLHFHWNKVWHNETWTIHEAHIRSPEERLEVFSLYNDSYKSDRSFKVGRTFPGVLDALTLCVPNKAFNKDDFPTFG